MPTNINWSRPFSEAAEVKTSAVTHALTVSGGKAIIDVTATVNAATKILERIILTPKASNTGTTHTVKHLIFSGGSDSVYVSATNPADSVATNAATAVETVLPDTLNLDSFYTAAGVGRTDPTP
ncbi:MAG: hypothetical protein KME15_19930 [Drouetiella hepatica Uher 2000/2452]|jgi:hypothetical protein|uniref:Uncharacterized protein n=1 Tax=Drouetiella hepatica Uher 2000/2452 TaxID=904376 RepID=A0A951UNN6_9CYAN|nr:hypothetical protein [Drouetiella hepatica Uher 2000/2452]